MSIQVYSAITAEHDPPRDDIPVFTNMRHFHNPILAARFYKMIPHLLFPTADWTIWVDGNVFLNVEPEELVGVTERTGSPLGVFAHYHRTTVWEEGAAVIQAELDEPTIVREALGRYTAQGTTGSPLAMTMVVVRKNVPLVADFNRRWWEEICFGSVRDQLSFPLVNARPAFQFPLLPTVDFTQPNHYFTRISE